MADKQLTFANDAHTSLMRGVNQLGRVVGLTLGPSGRNVLLSCTFGLPIVCSDGVTIAKGSAGAGQVTNGEVLKVPET